MANYTAADVKKLRELTGSGMMDCKKALEEAEGDFDKAVELLRIKGAKDVYYPGAPHGITATHQDQINAELLAFIKGEKYQVANS